MYEYKVWTYTHTSALRIDASPCLNCNIFNYNRQRAKMDAELIASMDRWYDICPDLQMPLTDTNNTYLVRCTL
jgi:hypothetical protein